ncbi:AfsR/SARP family transcriptional regulator [Catelliglobosispora koreensis]|uniref:AfsR/SARP family transcriptional regulator n=1 Tax=Catelliglobosispora koreensis TaxID=129052 RepID=UPI00146F21C1|nr:BTAD domain-containing putative transcriptional regulator [Catelliglobosispora koreensis]
MRFRVLGNVAAEFRGQHVVLNRRRERCLLGLLMLEAGRPMPASRLTQLLWEEPPENAKRTLHSHIARIRAFTGDALTASDSGYTLHIDPQEVDVHLFQALTRQAQSEMDLIQRLSTLERALALWQGPVLGDNAGPALHEKVAASWESIRLSAQELHLATLVELGRRDEALPLLQQLNAEDPGREPITGLLMTTLYQAGRKAESLAAYERTRVWLAAELGIDPTPMLQAAHVKVLRDELCPPPAIPQDLPAPASAFTGRDEQVALLQQLLGRKSQAGPVVTLITGTAGIGKTTLAIEAAHRVASSYPGGQIYLNLNGYSHSQPLSVLDGLTRLLRSLGVAASEIPADEEAAASLLASRIAGRRVLLVLDNVGSAGQIKPLLPATAGNAAIVTSRARLGSLIGTHSAHWLPLETLTAAEAHTVLEGIIGSSRCDADRQSAAEIANRCARLPLALRMAGANLAIHPHWSLAEYAAQMRDQPLNALEVDGDAAVRTAFQLSYDRLPAAAQRLFCLLGVAIGPEIGAEAASAMAGLDPHVTHRLLDQLCAASLVIEHRAHRYSLHDLIREHAREQAAQNHVTGEPLRQLTEWYLSMTVEASATAYPMATRHPAVAKWRHRVAPFPDVPTAMAFFAQELPNLVAAVQSAAQQPYSHIAWLLTDSLRGFYNMRVPLLEWTVTAEAALKAALAAADPLGEAAARLSLSGVLRRQAKHDDAIRELRHTIDLCQQTGWEVAESAAHNNLGVVYLELMRPHEAMEAFKSALDGCRADNNQLGESLALGNLGGAYQDLGMLAESIDLAQQQLDRYGEYPQPNVLSNISASYQMLGEYAKALDYARRAHDLAQTSGDRWVEPLALENLATALRHLGDLEGAMDHAQQSLAKAAAGGFELAAARATAVIGSIHLAARRYPEAASTYQESLAKLGRSRPGRAHLRAVLGLAEACAGLGDHKQARTLATQALDVALRSQLKLREADALNILSHLDAVGGDMKLAQKRAERVAEICDETGYRLTPTR